MKTQDLTKKETNALSTVFSVLAELDAAGKKNVLTAAAKALDIGSARKRADSGLTTAQKRKAAGWYSATERFGPRGEDC